METPAVDPAATQPITTTAPEASVDPVRPIETSALNPESRPELNDSTDAPITASTTEAPIADSTAATTAATVDSQPMTEGVLGYKAPGLVKSLIFSKKFFWFSDEPVEHKHLSGYVSNEKSDVAHPNAAHAAQTGKGLLFFAKRAEDRPQPAGILNLADISDVSKVDFNDFSFKLHGHKHTFQAQSRADRDAWITAVETRATEAKGAREGIVSSTGYKSSLEKLGGAGALAAAPAAASRSMSRPKKSMEGRLREEPVAGTVVTANGPAIEETKTASTTATATEKKSRSQSRKRNSIFGTLMGKKEEHDVKKEEKKEEKAEEKAVEEEVKQEEKAEKRAEKEEKKELKHEGASAAAPLDAAAIASRVVAEPVVPVEDVTSAGAADIIPGENATTAAVEPSTGIVAGETRPTVTTSTRDNAPRPNKRNSIFGSFFGKKDITSPTKEEAAPVVPIKDAEPTVVSATPPQLEDPVNTASQPIETAPVATTDKLNTTPASTPATKQNVSPSATKGGIFGFMKQKEMQHEEKKEIKAEEKVETGASSVPTATTETLVPTAATTTETSAPITSPLASPITAATTPDNGRNSRRQSFFSTLGTKKEKKTGAISDGEATDGEGKKSASSKLGGLFRKPSRAQSGKPTTKIAEPVSGLPKETTDNALIREEAPTMTQAPHTDGEAAVDPLVPAGEKPMPDAGTEAISSGHPQSTPAVEASA